MLPAQGLEGYNMLKVCDTIRIHATTTNDYVSILAANAIEQRLRQVSEWISSNSCVPQVQGQLRTCLERGQPSRLASTQKHQAGTSTL
jgi:hypothetical protein